MVLPDPKTDESEPESPRLIVIDSGQPRSDRIHSVMATVSMLPQFRPTSGHIKPFNDIKARQFGVNPPGGGYLRWASMGRLRS